VATDSGENDNDEYGDGGSPSLQAIVLPTFFVTTCGKNCTNI